LLEGGVSHPERAGRGPIPNRRYKEGKRNLPSGSQWLHEIKHDGFRIIARKTGAQVRLYSRPGNDLTRRSPLIVETLARLRSRSCIIDGEAVACDDNGVAGQDQGSFFRCQTAPWKYSYMLGGMVSLCSLVSNVFAYHLRVQEAVTANAAMPLVAGEDVRTPLGTFRIVFGVGHFNKSCI